MRARNIKPGFFKNEELADFDPIARILFIGLWCMADREGRLEYRPKRIKVEILPYDNCSIEKLLTQLSKNFITLYEIDGEKYIQINNFKKHQNCHIKEGASTIPAPVSHGASMEVAHLIPDSLLLNPDILITDSKEKAAPEKNHLPVDNSKPSEEIPEPLPDIEEEDHQPVADNPDSLFLQNLKETMQKLSEIYTTPHGYRQISLFIESNIRQGNHDAILHCLNSLIGVYKNSKEIIGPVKAWLDAAMKCENGNYNARDHDIKSQEYKKPITEAGMSAIKNVLQHMAQA